MIIFLTGENDYAIKSSVDQLRGEFVKTNGVDGLEQYDAVELEINRLPDLISGGSLFSEKRLIIVRDIGANKDLAESIAAQAGSVDETTTLVLTQAQPDKRTRWYKTLQPHAKNLANPRGAQLLDWLMDEAKQRNMKLDRATAKHLITVVGENQWRLSGELDKLNAAGQAISVESIDRLVEPASEETIFQLIDRTVDGRAGEALVMYERLRLGEIDPHQFIGTLSWQLDALSVVKTNQDKPTGQLASASGLSPFVIDRLKTLTRRLTLGQIKNMMNMTLNADYDMKQTGIDVDQRAKLLIAQLGQITS